MPMDMDEVFAFLRGELEEVEEVLNKSLSSEVVLISQVGRYIFQSGGKRMRPLMTILCSRLCGYRGRAHIPLAAVVELIHTATLLHDDVVDHADLRRGTRSVNYLWDSETSILVGDFLFTRSFCMMVEHRDMRILDLMSNTCRQLAEGEILELTKSGDPRILEEEYLTIVRNKTAVLISAACQMGAILGESPTAHERALAAFGLNIGMAFQLVDDILDYSADEKDLGKTVGKDLQEGKVTLPVIRTLKCCDQEEREKVEGIIRSRSYSQDDLKEILRIIKSYDGLNYAQRRAVQYVEAAKEHLSPFPNSREKEALLTVADFVATRRR